MRRLCVLQTKVDVVESHILRTVGLDQARGSIADGMDCRRSNCFLATSVEQTAGGHCETELQFVPTVMDSGVPPPPAFDAGTIASRHAAAYPLQICPRRDRTQAPADASAPSQKASITAA